MKLILCAACASFIGTMTFAGQSFDGSGTGSGQSMNEVTVLGEGHMLVQSLSAYEPLATNDPENPMAGLPGKCFGSFEINRASAAGAGHCVFAKEGVSTVVTDWVVTGMTAEGAMTGTWSVIGASGAAAGLTGGGRFSNLSNREAGTFENTITGAVAMP
ncbi:hypothetical protein [Dinoroseobacter sp. S76]|uniref:hypothetical protein n=1 Tax=Dinoroseobacter sp. S76 TaxID=3415124 RepID=UPI003C7A67DC